MGQQGLLTPMVMRGADAARHTGASAVVLSLLRFWTRRCAVPGACLARRYAWVRQRASWPPRRRRCGVKFREYVQAARSKRGSSSKICRRKMWTFVVASTLCTLYTCICNPQQSLTLVKCHQLPPNRYSREANRRPRPAANASSWGYLETTNRR